MQYATLGDTVYFGFAANTTAGTAGDGASPTFAVRKAGAASSTGPVLTGTPTLLSHASYSDGSHEIAVAATVGNGFEADATYLVFCSLTISTVTPNGYCGKFKLSPVNANITQVNSQTATAAAGVTFPSSIASPTNITAGTITTVTNLTNAPTVGDLTATMKTSVTAAVPTVAQIDTQLTGTHGTGSWVGLAGATAAEIAAELASEPIRVSSPTTTDGTLDLMQGVDYYTADGREIEFTFVRDYVPDSCKLTIASGSVVTVTSTDIEQTSGSGSGQFHVRFQVPRTTGDDLDAGYGTFEVISIVGVREIGEISEGVATIRRRLTA